MTAGWLDQQVALEGTPAGPARPLPAPVTDLRGLKGRVVVYKGQRVGVAYRTQDGVTVMIDQGHRILVLRPDLDAAVRAAVQLAVQRFGKRGVWIRGPLEFRQRAAVLAGELGLRVLDADLQALAKAPPRAGRTSRPHTRPRGPSP